MRKPKPGPVPLPSVIPTRLLRRAGEAMYGHRWQHQLGAACGFSQGMVSYMSRELRPIPREFLEALTKLANKRAADLAAIAAQLNHTLNTLE